LVTMEDLLECIFGDIPSPSDQVEKFELEMVGENSYSVDGGMPLEEFNKHIGTDFSDDEIETIGGLVLHAFGELPQEGESIELQGISFTTQTVSQNRIAQLEVTPPSPIKDEAQAPSVEEEKVSEGGND